MTGNSVTTRQSGAVGPASAPRVSPVAKLLGEIRRTLLDPMATVLAPKLDDLRTSLQDQRKAWRADAFLDCSKSAEYAVGEALQTLDRLTPASELAPVVAVAEAILATPADIVKNRTLIGLMLDSYPNASPHAPESYVEVLIHHAMSESFPPHAVAAACDEIVSTAKFLPAPSEFLEVCRAKQGQIWSRLRIMKQAIEVRGRIDAALTEAEAIRDADLTEQQREYGEAAPWPFEAWKAEAKAFEAARSAFWATADAELQIEVANLPPLKQTERIKAWGAQRSSAETGQ